jgi:hypothetical protein
MSVNNPDELLHTVLPPALEVLTPGASPRPKPTPRSFTTP